MMQDAKVSANEFQSTIVGELPRDWEVVNLSDVAEIVPGQSPSSTSYNDDGRGLPFFQGKAEFGSRYPTAVKWCDTPKKIGKAGDVLMSVRAPVGDVNLAPYECCIGRGLAAIRSNSNSHSLYLFYLLGFAKSRLEREGTGSTFKGINKSILTVLPIPLPPLPEQRRIAAVLNAIQDEIAAQEDLIRALREFKRSVMARLFTYGASAVPAKTKMTEVGEIPLGWELSSVEDVIEEFISGDWGEEFDDPEKDLTRCTVIRGTDFPKAGIGILSNAPMRYIKSSRIRQKQLVIGDVLIEISGGSNKQPTGRILQITASVVSQSEDPLICTNFVKLLRLDRSSVNVDFFTFYWSCLYEMGKTTIYEKRTTGIRNFKYKEFVQREQIRLPQIDEQRRIADILNAIQNKVAAEKDRKAALQEFFRSMLQQLMTGQIRLLSDEGLPL